MEKHKEQLEHLLSLSPEEQSKLPLEQRLVIFKAQKSKRKSLADKTNKISNAKKTISKKIDHAAVNNFVQFDCKIDECSSSDVLLEQVDTLFDRLAQVLNAPSMRQVQQSVKEAQEVLLIVLYRLSQSAEKASDLQSALAETLQENQKIIEELDAKNEENERLKNLVSANKEMELLYSVVTRDREDDAKRVEELEKQVERLKERLERLKRREEDCEEGSEDEDGEKSVDHAENEENESEEKEENSNENCEQDSIENCEENRNEKCEQNSYANSSSNSNVLVTSLSFQNRILQEKIKEQSRNIQDIESKYQVEINEMKDQFNNLAQEMNNGLTRTVALLKETRTKYEDVKAKYERLKEQ